MKAIGENVPFYPYSSEEEKQKEITEKKNKLFRASHSEADLSALQFWCNDNTVHINNPDYQKNNCCIMHIIGLPRDPVTKQEIPLTNEQISFANRALTFGNKKQMISELTTALRKRNDTERNKEIKKIAATILPDLEDDYIPLLPTDRIEWEYHCRPEIKGEINRLKYLPMMLDIVKDTHPFQMYLLGRQWGKTTMIGTDLAYYGTINYDYDQTYVNFKNDNLRTFSENKFRQDVFGTAPLSHYISGVSKLGAMNRVVTKTRSIIDMLLPGKNWENLQGKSNRRMVIDEGNDIDWEGFQNARETQSDTFGDLVIAGIGGFVDSQYHNIWKSTNQMEYIFDDGDIYEGYDNMSWRNSLQFDEKGLIYDDYMLQVLSGKWVSQKPENTARHGYHLTQLQNPRIPLTIQDAIQKYKISPEFSIEWKLQDPDYTQIEYRRNVLAEFVEGELKPITERDMRLLFDDTISLTTSENVNYDAGPVIIGIDWGGGGKTILWIWQCIDETALIFKLLWVEKIDTSDTDAQWEIVKNLCDAYEPDFISIDAGGASDRVQKTQKRYGNRTRRITYTVRPEAPLPTLKEEIAQSLEMRYVIDRTFSINRIIDLIKHPHTKNGNTTNRIILPGADYEKVKWIIPQFVAIEGEYSKLKSTGQTYIKYTHPDSKPDDALQACNYAFIGFDIYKGVGEGHVGGGVDMTRKYNSYGMDDVL